MRFVTRRGNKLKFLGLTVYKERHKDGRITRYVLNVPVRRAPDEAWLIGREYERAKAENRFDMRELDAQIAALAEKTCPKLPKIQNLKQKNIAFMASRLFDVGGHTESMRNLIEALSPYYEQKLFLSELSRSEKDAPSKMKGIRRYAEISGIDADGRSFERDLRTLTERIAAFAPKALIAFIHPGDVLSACALSLLKKRTDIKVIYANHASHYPCLGMGFADAVMEGSPQMVETTERERKLDTAVVAGLFCRKKEDVPSFSEEAVRERKKQIGIPEGALCTMSGGAAYKFFDGERSEYFEMIAHLLEKHENLFHAVLSDFTPEQLRIIDAAFDGKKGRTRLILLPFSADYELTLKCADVFIDSFPVSGAMIQIDLMMLKVPSVVKINRNEPRFSFHEYLPENYPYMFETAAEIESGTERLLSSPEERFRATELNYARYLDRFESRAYGERIRNLIENVCERKAS